MKVLLTGASGFVGRHVVESLLKKGHEVIAIARDKEKAEKLPWFKDVQFYTQDIHANGYTPLLVQLGNPDALMHLSWGGLPNYKSLFHFEKNLPADYQFLKALIDQGLKQLLVTGTCFEYGMQSGCLSEDMQAIPDNPYALAKDTLRKFLQALQQEAPFTLQWARLFYMYGNGQNPRSLLAQLDHAVDQSEKEFNMSGGEQLRDFLPVQIVAERLVTVIENFQFNGIVNICNGTPVSVRSLVEQTLNEYGRSDMKLNLGYYPYPDYEPMAFWGSSEIFNNIRT